MGERVRRAPFRWPPGGCCSSLPLVLRWRFGLKAQDSGEFCLSPHIVARSMRGQQCRKGCCGERALHLARQAFRGGAAGRRAVPPRRWASAGHTQVRCRTQANVPCCRLHVSHLVPCDGRDC